MLVVLSSRVGKRGGWQPVTNYTDFLLPSALVRCVGSMSVRRVSARLCEIEELYIHMHVWLCAICTCISLCDVVKTMSTKRHATRYHMARTNSSESAYLIDVESLNFLTSPSARASRILSAASDTTKCTKSGAGKQCQKLHSK